MPLEREVPVGIDQALTTFNQAKDAISMQSARVACRIILRDVEPVVSANFFDKYFNMIVLPNCHPQFYHGWIAEIKQLMTQHPSLYYSVLACSASQVHSLSGTPQMRGLALEYYDRSIKGVLQLVDVESAATHNGLLMTIILLYLHGCLGQATLTDVPHHVEAAIRLLRLRLFNGNGTIWQPFDRIAVESVLYQIFLTEMGSWTVQTEQRLQFDTEFWLQAERVLAQSTLFPGESPSVNSPVLGVPVALFRLTLAVKNQYRSPQPDPDTITHLRDELGEWEALVLQDGDIDPAASQSGLSHYSLYKDSAFLYILIASLLLDQTSALSPEADVALKPEESNSWQVAKMLQVLQNQRGVDEWATCFISNWPIYTVGFFLGTKRDQDVIRQELLRRLELTGFSQAARFLADLEATWAARDGFTSVP